MRLEAEYGVPSVAVHAHVFSRLVASSTRANGMPRTRHAFVPQPVADQSASQLRAYVDGDDPISTRPFIREVLEGLTLPLTEEDMKGVAFERTTPRLLEPDTEENLHRLFLDSNWTDKLPIVLPTEDRVAAMLAGTSHAADEVLGR